MRRFTAAPFVLLAACSAPPDAATCDAGKYNYVQVHEQTAGADSLLVDAIAITLADGSRHWASTLVEWYDQGNGEARTAVYGPPDGTCGAGYTTLTNGGYVLVSFDVSSDDQPRTWSSVEVYTVDGCGADADYDVNVLTTDADASWTALASTNGSSTLAVPGCDDDDGELGYIEQP
jgi:hypothetical protein